MATFTNAGGRFFICATPQPTDLTKEQFEALVWVEVKNVGSLPESGATTNTVSYDTVDTDVTQKAKGITNAGDGSLEVARIQTDPGQIALRAAALTKFYYATKRELTDAPDANHTNTIYYNRGLIGGPAHAGGRNEDFILETFTFGYVQREIVVGPVSLVAPTNTLLPSISGIAQDEEVLTAIEGIWTGNPSFTYQWQEDDSGWTNLAAGTSRTYTVKTADVGKPIRVIVTGTNPAGSASATSGVTADVLA